ncbi:NAD-dependent epimerase/dehydratase family protein [Acidimicrobiia bacterium]|nr:NAD-dependent epimerase/dehydratase family protein [Candidatus Actinomarina sp.]MDA9844815.1 NAD-dependent epimerase/dehydratase family protein [Acidimicrobiia bacterium]
MNSKSALVLGGGGFIGSHMVKRLKSEGYFVRAIDLHYPEFSTSMADEFNLYDLTNPEEYPTLLTIDGQPFHEIYQYAADMGGAGFIFTGENDAAIMTNSGLINLNLLKAQHEINNETSNNYTKIFYSSSACIYPEYNQLDPDNPNCSEDSAYPAEPDSEYGWEKLFSERLFLSYNKNFDIPVRIARFHNIFGPEGTFDGGREKAPAAMCRKVAKSKNNEIEIWGDGKQTRSFLYIDECLEATRRLMNSKFIGPINIGSEEMVSINQLVKIVADVAKKSISIKHIDGPLGVRGRNSDNNLIRKELNWDYKQPLSEGIEKTYLWIEGQLKSESD